MVLLFSALLIIGIVAGQWLDLAQWREGLSFVTSGCLAYIMIEVGLEFSVEKRSIKSYGWDFLIASSAALLPVILCLGYFLIIMHSQWKPGLLASLSTAPTSAGVLFSMMLAAGLGATWVFQKARVLAILDDLVTILLLTPLTIVIQGFHWGAILTLGFIGGFLFAAFSFQNTLRMPTSKIWLLAYALILTGGLALLNASAHIHLEVLIPAFTIGCMIKVSGGHKEVPSTFLDTGIKGLFMMLVGLSFPKVMIGAVPILQTAGHVLALTLLANVGKLFLVFCYRKEATLKDRLALGVAMFPRGEVGAAVLLIGIGFGLAGYENALAVLSLALNLIMTGVFIWIVIRLLKKD